MRRVLTAALLSLVVAFPSAHRSTSDLPAALTDSEFWALVQRLSEPSGSFGSDNLVSNEVWFQHVISDLVRRSQPVDAYVGVGPEQNFTYVAAVQPKIAFIVDIRRGNLLLHLMYKALFELSKDRATFVSRLFGRPLPRGGEGVSAADLFAALERGDGSTVAGEPEYETLRDHLTRKRGLPLSSDDLRGIHDLLLAFHRIGPPISYASPGFVPWMPSYARMMTETDGTAERSFLSSEERFNTVRDLHLRNLIVPLVGNLAGPTTLRGVGAYLRNHAATLGVMYLSNVEYYLIRDRSWRAFCGNVASMPVGDRSTFIRSSAIPQTERGSLEGLMSYLGSVRAETVKCAE